MDGTAAERILSRAVASGSDGDVFNMASRADSSSVFRSIVDAPYTPKSRMEKHVVALQKHKETVLTIVKTRGLVSLLVFLFVLFVCLYINPPMVRCKKDPQDPQSAETRSAGRLFAVSGSAALLAFVVPYVITFVQTYKRKAR